MFLPLHHSLHYASPNVCADGEENEVMELIWLGKNGSQKNLGSPQAKQTKPTAMNDLQWPKIAKLPNGKPQPQSAYKLLHILHSAMYLLRTERE